MSTEPRLPNRFLDCTHGVNLGVGIPQCGHCGLPMHKTAEDDELEEGCEYAKLHGLTPQTWHVAEYACAAGHTAVYRVPNYS